MSNQADPASLEELIPGSASGSARDMLLQRGLIAEDDGWCPSSALDD